MKKTKKIFLILSLIFSLNSLAQNTEGVKIGSVISPPNPSAMFEVQSSNKGVLFPKIQLQNISTYTPIAGVETEGIIVYNTNDTIVGGCGKGYYTWNGTIWERLGRECVVKMSFQEMINFTTNLDPIYDIGYQVYVTDTNILYSSLSYCIAHSTSCSPSTVNPSGIWTYTATELIPCGCDDGVQWSKDIPLPSYTCFIKFLCAP